MIKSAGSVFALLLLLPLTSYADDTADTLAKATEEFEKSCQQSNPGSNHFFDCKCLSTKYAELPDNKLENQNKKVDHKLTMMKKIYLTKSQRFSKRYGADNLVYVESICLENEFKVVRNKLRNSSAERKFDSRQALQLCSYKNKISVAKNTTYRPVPYDLAMTRFSVQNICIDPALIQQSANVHCHQAYKRAKQSAHFKRDISIESFCKCYTDSYKKSITRGGSSSKLYIQRESRAYLACIQ